jgi:molybdate transport system permease protein
MDWQALRLSVELGLATVAGLGPLALWLGRLLAFRRFRGKGFAEAMVALPLLLPPTVVGFYLLQAFGRASPLGAAFEGLFGRPLVFSFAGLLLASILVNIPFAVQPAQRGFEAIEPSVREAAAVCGLSPWQVFLRIELPLAWPGIVTGLVLTFAHTLGEFGVVLMVGGSIPGETRTIAIAIYDRVQAFDDRAANAMALALLALSLAALGITNTLSRRIGRRHA